MKGNILTLHSEDDGVGGSRQFAHIVRTEKYEIVQVNAARFATEKEVFFTVGKVGFDDICETALSFEYCVISEYKKFKAVEGNESSSDSNEEEPQEPEGDSIVYGRQHSRARGNRYHLVISGLLSEKHLIYSVLLSYKKKNREKTSMYSYLLIQLIDPIGCYIDISLVID